MKWLMLCFPLVCNLLLYLLFYAILLLYRVVDFDFFSILQSSCCVVTCFRFRRIGCLDSPKTKKSEW